MPADAAAMHADPTDTLLAQALCNEAGERDARVALRASCEQADAQGDPARGWLAAAAVLRLVAADFVDFRGLDWALPRFAAGADDPPALARPLDQARADAALLAWPSLDHAVALDDPRVAAAHTRLLAWLQTDQAAPPDERLLLGKLLVDHLGLLNDLPAVERLMAGLQDLLHDDAVSPGWRGRWWLLVAQNAEYWGRMALAREAADQAQALIDRHDLRELHYTLLCSEMELALRADDLARADRVFARLEQLRPHVRSGCLPHGLRAQAALQIRRGEPQAALERIDLLLALCRDLAVPERDCGAYRVLRSYGLTALQRHDEALAELASLRPSQSAGQTQMLDAIVAVAQAAQALHESRADARACVAQALRQCAAQEFSRFLMPLPALAARMAEIGLADGVAVEFVTRAIRERRLLPADPARADWPWAVHVQVLGGLRVRREGVPLGGAGGKGQRKPLELLALLAAHPQGLDAPTLIDALWPSLEADAPRASLEMTVSRLRKWLDCAEAVRVADGRVALNPGLVWTDVAALEAAASRGDAQTALSLYTGPLLQGERLAGPAAQARERLALQLSACVLQAAAALRQAGRGADAQALLARGLAAEPSAGVLQAALRA